MKCRGVFIMNCPCWGEGGKVIICSAPMTKLEWLSAARDKLGLQEGQEMLLQISWGAWERVDQSKWGAGGYELGSQADPRPPKALRPPSRSSASTPCLGNGRDAWRAVCIHFCVLRVYLCHLVVLSLLQRYSTFSKKLLRKKYIVVYLNWSLFCHQVPI